MAGIGFPGPPGFAAASARGRLCVCNQWLPEASAGAVLPATSASPARSVRATQSSAGKIAIGIGVSDIPAVNENDELGHRSRPWVLAGVFCCDLDDPNGPGCIDLTFGHLAPQR
jgi:hypothetical protein